MSLLFFFRFLLPPAPNRYAPPPKLSVRPLHLCMCVQQHIDPSSRLCTTPGPDIFPPLVRERGWLRGIKYRVKAKPF